MAAHSPQLPSLRVWPLGTICVHCPSGGWANWGEAGRPQGTRWGAGQRLGLSSFAAEAELSSFPARLSPLFHPSPTRPPGLSLLGRSTKVHPSRSRRHPRRSASTALGVSLNAAWGTCRPVSLAFHTRQTDSHPLAILGAAIASTGEGAHLLRESHTARRTAAKRVSLLVCGSSPPSALRRGHRTWADRSFRAGVPGLRRRRLPRQATLAKPRASNLSDCTATDSPRGPLAAAVVASGTGTRRTSPGFARSATHLAPTPPRPRCAPLQRRSSVSCERDGKGQAPLKPDRSRLAAPPLPLRLPTASAHLSR